MLTSILHICLPVHAEKQVVVLLSELMFTLSLLPLSDGNKGIYLMPNNQSAVHPFQPWPILPPGQAVSMMLSRDKQRTKFHLTCFLFPLPFSGLFSAISRMKVFVQPFILAISSNCHLM